MSWQDYIVVDPAICHGKACIKGTRIMVWLYSTTLLPASLPMRFCTVTHP
jgi:hypothetical protein